MSKATLIIVPSRNELFPERAGFFRRTKMVPGFEGTLKQTGYVDQTIWARTEEILEADARIIIAQRQQLDDDADNAKVIEIEL